ncbi:MFS transporter [Kaistia sp. 32K]|uniref:MFS transporter n=1 Tax=Kaistia sp. 32K TaxID=2795690 RepID=UPI001915491C|nr:MFS transporter [Kaistia sp. 32K]BCP53124.1 MFS transporter [Kaistia sp. 32K]
MVAAPRHFGLRISLFYIGFFVVGGLMTPFFPVWLKLRGLTPEEIGACLAFPLAARLLFMPVGSAFADRAPNRRFAVVVFTLFGLLFFLPATLVTGYWPILLLTGIATAMLGLSMPAIDALALTGVRRFGLDYGNMRVWGSISFIAISLVGGVVFGHLGPASLSPMLIGAYVIAAVTAFLLPVTPPEIRAADDAAKPEAVSARAILMSREFVVVIASFSLITASHAVFYSFGTIYWEQLGFSGSEIGLLWAAGVVAEIGMFAVSGKALRRLQPERLIMLGAVAAIVRWGLFPFATDLVFSLALQLLHALTFAAVYAGMQLAIARQVPDAMMASAQGISQTASGLALAATTLLSGPLYGHLGAAAFPTMMIGGVLAILVLLVPRKPRSAPE